MNRLLWIGSLAGLLLCSTGCLRQQTRGGCKSCSTPVCETGECGSSSCNTCSTGTCGESCQSCESSGGGLLGKLTGKKGCGCGDGCRTGCVAGPIGWQQGGLDYSSHLNPGLLGHRASSAMSSQPMTPGPQTGQTAYPYYTVRGPRDFLLDNPPTIGR